MKNLKTYESFEEGEDLYDNIIDFIEEDQNEIDLDEIEHKIPVEVIQLARDFYKQHKENIIKSFELHEIPAIITTIPKHETGEDLKDEAYISIIIGIMMSYIVEDKPLWLEKFDKKIKEINT